MSTPPDASRRPHVLLAEDDSDLRETLSDLLGTLGNEVEAVPDGGRFLVSIASHYDPGCSPAQVDLIVADVGLPVCGGLEILEAIRTAGWTTPVLIITGLVTPTVSMRATKLRASLLIKPFDAQSFESRVAELLLAGPLLVPRAGERPSRRPAPEEPP